MSTLDERSYQECTKDVIFVFQTLKWIFTGEPFSLGKEYEYDGEGWYEVGQDEDDFEYLSFKDLSELETLDGIPCALKEWQTEAVFLTREEGEAYGRGREYRWDGWRVYGVPMMGDLPQLIKKAENG